MNLMFSQNFNSRKKCLNDLEENFVEKRDALFPYFLKIHLSLSPSLILTL